MFKLICKYNVYRNHNKQEKYDYDYTIKQITKIKVEYAKYYVKYTEQGLYDQLKFNSMLNPIRFLQSERLYSYYMQCCPNGLKHLKIITIYDDQYKKSQN